MNKKSLNLSAINHQLENQGINQAFIAKEMGVSRESVSQWFKNNIFPKPYHLIKLAKILKLSYDEIVKRELEYAPQIAFRKAAGTKTKKYHLTRALEMGKALEELVSFLPFNELRHPSTLINPQFDYSYIQIVVQQVRKKLRIINDKIEFYELIDCFNELKAVLIPVLWGTKRHHENALHIYLPKSMTTWIYLNLDTKIFDFKFWMAHEIGHILAPELRDEEGEDFSDSFAGALLFPEKLVDAVYKELVKIVSKEKKINHIIHRAQELVISPLTIFYQLNRYTEFYNLKDISLGREMFSYNAQFNKKFELVSDTIFNSERPTNRQYIKVASKDFKSPIFDTLREYNKSNELTVGMLQNIFNISLVDSKNLLEALVNEAN